MTFDQLWNRAASSNEVLAVVVAAVLSSLGWLALRIYTGRPKVAWAFSHQHAFNLQKINPPILAFTKEIWIQNVGRVLAEGVEVVFPIRPAHFDVWPQRQFTELTNPEGNFTLRFDHINPKEYLTIFMFQTTNPPSSVINIRWKGGVGAQRPMSPQQIFPLWMRLAAQSFCIFGLFSFLYFIMRIL